MVLSDIEPEPPRPTVVDIDIKISGTVPVFMLEQILKHVTSATPADGRLEIICTGNQS